jgi:hypothetical protein
MKFFFSYEYFSLSNSYAHSFNKIERTDINYVLIHRDRSVKKQ